MAKQFVKTPVQTIGRKSIVKKLEIPNHSDRKKVNAVLIQANKNYGICDILRVIEPSGEKVRMSELLSEFQGRQINDENTIIHLWNVLEEVLNPVK